MSQRVRALAAACLLLVASAASAQKKEVWHGWTDMPGIPCSKVTYYKDSFGNRWPTVKTANQEHHTRIYLNLPTSGEVESKVKECVGVGVAASGAVAFFTTPATAWAAFKGAFLACTAEKGLKVAENALTINAGTTCKW